MSSTYTANLMQRVAAINASDDPFRLGVLRHDFDGRDLAVVEGLQELRDELHSIVGGLSDDSAAQVLAATDLLHQLLTYGRAF